MTPFERRMDRMMMPEKYRSPTVNIKGIPKACLHRDSVKEYGKNLHDHLQTGRGVLLWGNSSTGKSAIAGMCLKRLLDFNAVHTGLWVTARRVPQYVIEGTEYDEEETMAERMISVDLLVIDEFMTFKGDNTYRQDIIEHTFRDRSEKGRTTIITTNMTLIELNKQAYTFFQVIQEHCEILKVTGHNFRESMRKD